LLEPAGDRRPRGMTATGVRPRTEPGLQTGFTSFDSRTSGVPALCTHVQLIQ
jgi:hypothetical protein